MKISDELKLANKTKIDGYKKIIALAISGVVVSLLAKWGVPENITIGFMGLVATYFGCQSWVDKTKYGTK